MNKSLIFISLLICISCLLSPIALFSTTSPITNVLNDQIAIDTLNKNRLKLLAITGGGTYAIGSAGLYWTWYKDYPSQKFHFFNDLAEWNQVDKAGHIFSAYSQADLCYRGFRWTGVREDQAILYGSLSAALFQSTIEVMDGFSAEWGFSLSDFTANILGISSFAVQQKIWQEQRVRFKFSTFPKKYNNFQGIDGQTYLLEQRAKDLFGSGLLELSLKDYNAQTIWMSVNVPSFFKNSQWPKWLNVSLGYGAENMFGGFNNEWVMNDQAISLESTDIKRYRQFFISLDADLSKIQTSSKFLRTLLDILNTIKLPFSAVEINTTGGIKFHLIHF